MLRITSKTVVPTQTDIMNKVAYILKFKCYFITESYAVDAHSYNSFNFQTHPIQPYNLNPYIFFISDLLLFSSLYPSLVHRQRSLHAGILWQPKNPTQRPTTDKPAIRIISRLQTTPPLQSRTIDRLWQQQIDHPHDRLRLFLR